MSLPKSESIFVRSFMRSTSNFTSVSADIHPATIPLAKVRSLEMSMYHASALLRLEKSFTVIIAINEEVRSIFTILNVFVNVWFSFFALMRLSALLT